MTSTLPPNFTLTQYRLTLEALEPLKLPPFKGSALRGGFGHRFKGLVCDQPWPCDKTCRRGNACPYGYIFETSPPAEAEVLRNFEDVPRPFIIQDPQDQRSYIPAGENLTFGLTLVGQSNPYLPYFIAVFRELGRVGLGQARGQCRLVAVEAAFPFAGKTTSVYRADDETIHLTDAAVTAEAILTHAATLPPGQITLDFLTPARLKHQGRWITEGPPFQALIKVLISRVSSLSYFHCGQRFETDFRGLIDRAAEVRIVASDTHWQDWSRFSGRQKQQIDMGGLVGPITYAGDLRPYLPLLVLGQFIHVGKGNVFGNGQYQIVATISTTSDYDDTG